MKIAGAFHSRFENLLREIYILESVMQFVLDDWFTWDNTMSGTYIIQVATYLKGKQSSTHTSNKDFFFKQSLGPVVIKLPQIMVWQ